VAIVVERALHGSFFEQFGITHKAFAQTALSPTCDHYVSNLLATAYAEPYEVVLGALLPCFWIYAEVGRDIHARATTPNPYQAWIDTYAGEEFHRAVRAVIEATDEVSQAASPALRERMHEAFTRATQLEWAFWIRHTGSKRGQARPWPSPKTIDRERAAPGRSGQLGRRPRGTPTP
jgi:thiaminase/transcriptional activator TenA